MHVFCDDAEVHYVEHAQVAVRQRNALGGSASLQRKQVRERG